MTDCTPSSDGKCQFCGQPMPAAGVRRNCPSLGDAVRLVRPRIVVPRVPLGDMVERLLTSVGITEQLVSRLTRVSDCGCELRKRWLNNASFRVSWRIERALNSLADFYVSR